MTRFALLAGVLFQAAILLALAESVRRRDVAAAVNAGAALLVATSATILSPVVRLDPVPELTAWLGVAGFLHALGMLGLYESTGWWDHLTHTVSAALLAALVYAAATVAGDPAGFSLPVVVVTVGFALLAGVWWELVELLAREVGDRLDVDPLLVYYGRLDTAYDLAFDLLGTLIVVVLDLRVFVPVFRGTPDVAATAVRWGGGALLVSGIAMALVLGYGHARSMA